MAKLTGMSQTIWDVPTFSLLALTTHPVYLAEKVSNKSSLNLLSLQSSVL